MRYKIWLTLIICGTIIVLAPPLSDFLASHRISTILLERKDFNSVNFGLAPMSEQYRFGCWALGAAMILVGTIGGWREDATQPPEDHL
jgi:hypothetical protein